MHSPNRTVTRNVSFGNQVVVITGAAGGLGRAYAQLLAARGATVVVNDAGVSLDGADDNPAMADEVARLIRAAGGLAASVPINLDTAEACDQLIDVALQLFGRIDALIHSAGLLDLSPIEDLSVTAWERLRAVNVEAPLWLCRAVLPTMQRQHYGRIVLTISGHGMYADDGPGYPAYAVGKAAQFGLMNALAGTYRSFGVLVNAISPVAATRMFSGEMRSGLEPELVAPGVAYLVSRECRVSGAVLRAAGGRFSIGGYAGTTGIELSASDPDEIDARWDEIVAPPIRFLSKD